MEENKQEPVKKDHFKIVDMVFKESKEAHTVTDKLLDVLGDSKGPVLFTVTVGFALFFMDYIYTAKIFSVLMFSFIIVKMILSRGDGAVRDRANVLVDKGITQMAKLSQKKSKEADEKKSEKESSKEPVKEEKKE